MRTTTASVTATLAAVCLLSLGAGSAFADPTTGVETKCQGKLAKDVGKLWKTASKTITKCLDGEIAGKNSLPCPDAKGQAKIDKTSGKIPADVDKNCGGVCSTSTAVTCLSDGNCPPDGATSETCSDVDDPGADFTLANLGFPGPMCSNFVTGGPILTGADLGACLSDSSALSYNRFMDLVYGDIDSTDGIGADSAKCLAQLSKGVQKAVNGIYKAATKCRDAVNKGKLAVAPARCTVDDPKTAAAVAKALAKLSSTITGKCTDAQIAELDICDAGVGGTLTTGDADTCLSAAALELSDTLVLAPDRSFAGLSLVDVMFPATAPICGDGLINKLPDAFNPLGEECDLQDDSACPGECLPPGDLFECTCGNIKRILNVALGVGSDLDIGWTGFAHDQEVRSGSKYITDVTGCDCDTMTGAECTGTSGNPVCTLSGVQRPTCSWDLGGATTCDDYGNGDLYDRDSDCYICDGFSINPGALCVDESDCLSQCYDAGGSPTGACSSQTDCAPGEICRGRCDTSQSCAVINHGPPVAVVSGGAGACLLSAFTDDVVGTQDIVTGEHERFQYRRTRSHTGESPQKPCPICGGGCDGLPIGSPLQDRPCEGTCSISPDRCRFDVDCPGGETCTTAAPECGPGFCSLELVCIGSDNPGASCRVEGSPGTHFGTTSNDCLPQEALNFSGAGTTSDFAPSTSEALSLDPAAFACTAPAYALFDCPCDDTPLNPLRRASQPNDCGGTCNAGAELGNGCGTGTTVSGAFTTCVGGDNDTLACDEDADCAPGGGACSGNPTHCVGDPAFDSVLCTTNGDCGIGTCVDACPSGRCVPLCLPDPMDPEEGLCSVGATEIHCSNDNFRACFGPSADGDCNSTCSVAGTPCAAHTECPSGEVCEGDCTNAQQCEAGNDGTFNTPDDIPGAGLCIRVPRNCYLPGLPAEGGDTINGDGDAVLLKSVSVYCTDANQAAAANFVSGLGGPGRLRTSSVNFSNGFTSLP